jgi:hypothetical protein
MCEAESYFYPFLGKNRRAGAAKFLPELERSEQLWLETCARRRGREHLVNLERSEQNILSDL